MLSTYRVADTYPATTPELGGFGVTMKLHGNCVGFQAACKVTCSLLNFMFEYETVPCIHTVGVCVYAK